MEKATTIRKHLNTFVAEIESRGGEVSIYHSPRHGARHRDCYDVPLTIVSTGKSDGRKVWLLRCEGWRRYSNRFGARPAHLAYLCGYDDNGAWSVRVPGTCESATDAINYIVPKSVLKARAAGKRITRQGDVYAIETTKSNDGKGADELDSHEWYSRARVLLHESDRKHAPAQFDYPVRFVRQNGYQMGRGSARRYDD